jgi:hypothetical protein
VTLVFERERNGSKTIGQKDQIQNLPFGEDMMRILIRKSLHTIKMTWAVVLNIKVWFVA